MVGWPDRRFLDLVGTEYPIIQSPMSNVAGVDLCVAALRGGALGSLPCGMISPDRVREQVADVREQVSGPINLNFFCHHMPEMADDSAWRALLRPYYEEFGIHEPPAGALRLPFGEAYCTIVEEVRPEVVSFHFGLPEPELFGRVQAKGATILATATTVPGQNISNNAASTRSSRRGSRQEGIRGDSWTLIRSPRSGYSPCFRRSSTQ